MRKENIRPSSSGAVKMRYVPAKRDGGYEVCLLSDLAGSGCRPLVDALEGERSLLVTTPTVARLYGMRLYSALRQAGCDVHMYVLHCDEQSKQLPGVEAICAEAARHKLGRRSFLIGMGGGVCTDLVTMAASWIRRGIRHLRVPTTLIGQVDASVGVKGGVNFAGKKNALGCYYPPTRVFIDPAYLETLPTEAVSCGLAEMIKMAIVRDAVLFNLLSDHAEELLAYQFTSPPEVVQETLWRSVIRMLEELETNLFENQTYERLVDFGHTISPALEARSHFTLPHGKAVAINIAFSTVLAAEMGICRQADCDRILSALTRSRLPIWSPMMDEALIRQGLIETMAHRGGCVNLVVPTGIGEATFLRHLREIPTAALLATCDRLGQFSESAEEPLAA